MPVLRPAHVPGARHEDGAHGRPGTCREAAGISSATRSPRAPRSRRSPAQVFLFLNSKCKRLYNNKLKAAKLAWTALYRKAHKKARRARAAGGSARRP